MNGIPVVISHHLNFNMTEILDVLFNIYARIAEGRCRLLLRYINTFDELFFRSRHTDPFTAATCSSFNDDRLTHFLGKRNTFIRVLNDSF